jgi:hypothetical protein
MVIRGDRMITWDNLLENCLHPKGGYFVPVNVFRKLAPLQLRARGGTERDQLQSIVGDGYVVTEGPGYLLVKPKPTT